MKQLSLNNLKAGYPIMLARVVPRSLRCYSSPTPFRVISVIPFSRTYAKHNRPRRPSDYRPSQSSPSANQYDQDIKRPRDSPPAAVSPSFAASTPQSRNPSGDPLFSKIVEETKAEWNRSAEPTSPGSGQDFSTPDSPEASRQQPEPSPPLPDLTRGIPSTLDAELADASLGSRTNLSGHDMTEKSSAGGRGGEGLPNTAYISTLERRNNRLANYLYVGLLSLSIIGTIYMGRNWETEEEEKKHPDAPSGWGLRLFYNRGAARLRDMLDYYNEPAFSKLLPDVDPAWERPYTLVLSLEDLLVHSEWTREHGWRMAKRPGVDYFLRYLSQYYELVIFTSVPSMIGDPIIRKLDPFRIIMWPLFREATRFKNGEYIKASVIWLMIFDLAADLLCQDLSYLNRDLSKVILIDTVKAHAKLQPENAIILPKWKGDLHDNELVSLIPFLEYAGTMEFEDLRKVIESFEGTHIPTEFSHRESIARENFQQQLAEERAKRPRRSFVGSLGTALGIKPMGAGFDGMELSMVEGFDQGKTYQDQVRERGQRQYEMIEKEIRENGDKWLKEMAQEEEKMKEESMKGMKSSVLGAFGVRNEK